MRCPICQHDTSKVVDSRESTDGDAIRRRRECLECAERFTTYERVDAVMPMVVKKDKTREPWDREKLRVGVLKACEKRPVATDDVEVLVTSVEKSVRAEAGREIDSEAVGSHVMRGLRDLDDVAYVRFASVYKSFRDIDEFKNELDTLSRERDEERGVS